MKDHAVFTLGSRFIVIVCLSASLPVRAGETISQAPKAAGPAMPKLNLMKLPLSFERNQNEAATEVQFTARGPGYSLFLTPNEIVLMLAKGSGNSQSELPKDGPRQHLGADEPEGRESSVVRMKIVCANATPRLTGRDELPGKSHYFIGNDPSRWRTNVPNYAKVQYENVYPGVDLVFYGNQRQLEFDFVVSPGADPNLIHFVMEAASGLRLDAGGNLIIATEGGELVLHKPQVFQEIQGSRSNVAGRFVLHGERNVRFAVGSYDATRELVIDPILSYSTYLGGTAFDFASDIAVDSSGKIYVTGASGSPNFPRATGIGTLGAPGYENVFVTKIDPAKAGAESLIYSALIGGTNHDRGLAIAVDSSGNAYVGGQTQSREFPTLNPAQPQLGLGFESPQFGDWVRDGFVLRLNAAGSALDYSTFLGGSETDYVLDLALDSSGNAYVTGLTSSSAEGAGFVPFPETVGLGNTRESIGRSFIAKFSPAGARIYAAALHGPYDYLESIALDSAGNAYVSGYGFANDGEFAGAQRIGSLPTSADIGLAEGIVAKLNAAGNHFDYFTYFSGVASRSYIAVDAAGNAHVTGRAYDKNLPVVNAVQETPGGLPDSFAAKFNAAGNALLYATYLGGTNHEVGLGIVLDADGGAYVTGVNGAITKLSPNGSSILFSNSLDQLQLQGTEISTFTVDRAGNIYLCGSTGSTNFPTERPYQAALGNPPSNFITDAFVAMISPGQPMPEVQLWQKIEIATPTQTADGPTSFKVEFVRMVSGSEIRAQADVLTVRSNSVTVRVPPALLGPTAVSVPPVGIDPNVRVEVIRVATAQEIAREPLVLRFPQPIIVDELEVGQGSPAGLRTLTQFVLGAPSPNIHTFSFLGRSSDGQLGLRVLNTELRSPLPLRFDLEDVVAFEPEPATARLKLIGTPFHIPNLGPGNQGLQFNVSQNGLYVFAVEASTNSPGPFPARYQLHLAGNVGLPRRLVNGVAEFQRGTRLDTLFNHPAPRTQGLFPGNIGVARTALFKFANAASISQFARAVLIPPAGGFSAGMKIVRAADPTAPLEITTPTARTPDCAAPVVGTVIDFTQVPDPASVVDPSPILSESVCSVIGQNDGNGITLPKTLPDAAGTISSLILDMGSGTEIVDGTGADFEVLAATGSYSVRVGNTPYVESFLSVPGTFTGVQQIDLATAGLKSARYVWIIAAPTVVLDAVRSLNVFADEISPSLGAITHVTSTTITARRAKDAANLLDPFLQLIAPNGELSGENEAGFGDDLSLDLSDAALTGRALPQDGFYRYLVKGYDKQPDNQSSGTFFTRLETSGSYDPVELAVSNASEEQTTAQKTGTTSATRQRDSYLFQASPGTSLNIVVNATGNPPTLNPVVEFHDPEGFLIAANDDYPGRVRNAALSVTLPALTVGGAALPSPSTYRVVVSAIDGFGSTSPLSAGMAHIRQVVSGNYELKVFTGALTGGPPGGIPRIDLINPASGLPGTQVTLSGVNFSATASSNIVLFGSAVATVVTASTTQLVVVVPAGLPSGAASVTVAVGGQTSVPASFQISVPIARIAAGRLNCFSLRFLPGVVHFVDQNYTLELSSLDETLPSNGELFSLFDPLDFSHASNVKLRASNPSDSLVGFIVLNVPMASDADRDGVADFFQVSQGVGATQTQGEYFVDLDDGTVTATWSRAAGAKTGACRVVLRSSFLGQVADFTNAFELLEYTGSLTYTPGSSNVTGTVQFTQTQSSGNTLNGPIQFTRSPTNRLNELRFASGAWTNGVGRTLSYRNGVLQRVSGSNSNYFGSLAFLDGDLASTAEDYFDWILAIRDSNDVDGDGVPDLSDDPSGGAAPVFTRPRLEAGQIVLEWQGTGRLQSASEISGPWADVPGAVSPFRQTPVGTRQYFRIAP